LPAKEAMACGVPVILANNSGTRDLIDVDNCVSLNSQDPVPCEPGWDTGTDGWGESRVDEIVVSLEKLYSDSQLRRRIGARGAQWILENGRTWQVHAKALKAHLHSLL
jgi:glycosyltransferase involved in cell wall biosynthesis